MASYWRFRGPDLVWLSVRLGLELDTQMQYALRASRKDNQRTDGQGIIIEGNT